MKANEVLYFPIKEDSVLSVVEEGDLKPTIVVNIAKLTFSKPDLYHIDCFDEFEVVSTFISRE